MIQLTKHRNTGTLWIDPKAITAIETSGVFGNEIVTVHTANNRWVVDETQQLIDYKVHTAINARPVNLTAGGETQVGSYQGSQKEADHG